MMEPAHGELVPRLLEEYGALTRAALQHYLGDSSEPRATIYELASDYPNRGGRMLRASLCIAAARAFGAPPEDAVRTATSLELMHNAFLVHDDVEDEGEERRGRPTLNRLYGDAVAINVGDALAVMSLRPLMDNRRTLGPRLTLRILEETERMARETVEGQALELSWRRDNVTDLAERDYLQMVLKKTCWYTTIYPLRVGALIGRNHDHDLDRFLRFGFFLGAAFQIQDDLLNLVGDHARYGKELDGDLQEGKRTLMLIHVLQHADGPRRAALQEALRCPRSERSPQQVAFIRELMEESRSTAYAKRFAHALSGAARHEFARAFGALPDSRDKRFLAALPSWMLARA